VEGKFYTVVRQFFKGTAETHSMEIKQTYQAAEQRWLNILATDLDNKEITWNACYIIDSNGLMIEGRVYDEAAREQEETV